MKNLSRALLTDRIRCLLYGGKGVFELTEDFIDGVSEEPSDEFIEHPEKTYLLEEYCAHCGNYMVIFLHKDNIHKYLCKKCKKYNRIEGVRKLSDGRLVGDALKFND